MFFLTKNQARARARARAMRYWATTSEIVEPTHEWFSLKPIKWHLYHQTMCRMRALRLMRAIRLCCSA
ncbi:hypothetical protein Scep_000929 [Stephania cephalantha]|uniref:Uncharacterized protein n=1 Tax=Stephania cephalantha TaxID=152367 RepID=A0AAP0L8F4_9MAGN